MSMLRNPAVKPTLATILTRRSPRTPNLFLSTCKAAGLCQSHHLHGSIIVEKYQFTYANDALRASLPSEGAERFRAIEGVMSSATTLIDKTK